MSVKKKIVLLDGGTGSSLVAVGHSEIETHPLWSALLVRTNPRAIIDCHKKFYEAGSDIVISATYQASFEGYCKTFNMTEAEAADLITEGVRLACRARNESQESTNHSGWVAGGVGPYGAILGDRSEYHGKYADSMSSQELISWHTKRLAAILKGQPDLLAIETIPIVKEAEAIIESLKMFPAARAWISFQCKDGKSTGHGEMFVDAVRRSIQSDQIIAVGANCCSPENVVPLLQSISHLTLPVPILMKPNNISYISQEQCKTPLAEMASDWLDLGATWLGGCCHFGPRDISCLRQFLETRSDVILHSFSGV